MSNLETYFSQFRQNIIGIDKTFNSPYGELKIIYADWIASGRLYEPIERQLLEQFYPLVGNTHSESSVTGTSMTHAYHTAHKIIKQHCNAGPDDVIITAGSGMTALVNKFQRILGIKVCEQLKNYTTLPDQLRPVVFITHMEHHSNHTSWLETIAEVVVLPPNEEGLVEPAYLEEEIKKYKNRSLLIGSFTACSNVTGIETPYFELAEIMHRNNGYCFVDFACSAPYVKIDMHPENPLQKLDAIFFSPHKFLGGPGTPGVLIFDSKLYHNEVPDHPGGGTVDWTNPWGQHKFISNIETREDGGTPPFLQTIKAALCIKLKEEMGIEKMRQREQEIVDISFNELRKIPGLLLLADNISHRLAGISFYIVNLHYNLVVKLLNDRYGIQARGGCSCAGTYGHYLLHVNPGQSKKITDMINHGDLSEKPGWVRVSFHPTSTNEEVHLFSAALKEIVENIEEWKKDYYYSSTNNEFFHKDQSQNIPPHVENWFNLKSNIPSIL
jgi:selenocysteine lyase/cysteine desulfurase